MKPLSRPLAAFAELDQRGPQPVAVLAIGQHAGETVFTVVDRVGLVDTVSESRVRIVDGSLQAIADSAVAPEAEAPA